MVLVDGADLEQVRGDLESALAGYPSVAVLDTAELSDAGLSTLSLPLVHLAFVVAAGVLAAILPARRGARTNILRALQVWRGRLRCGPPLRSLR